MSNKELVCYVFVRNLPRTMNPGKMAAQVHHAGVHLFKEYSDHPDVLEYKKDLGFGTTIVLQCKSKYESEGYIKGIVSHGHSLHLAAGKITDPTYPVDVGVTANIITCGYVLVDIKAWENQHLINRINAEWELHA